MLVYNILSNAHYLRFYVVLILKMYFLQRSIKTIQFSIIIVYHYSANAITRTKTDSSLSLRSSWHHATQCTWVIFITGTVTYIYCKLDVHGLIQRMSNILFTFSHNYLHQNAFFPPAQTFFKHNKITFSTHCFI